MGDSGFIKIPESVKIDGKTYNVTGVKENTFRHYGYYFDIFSKFDSKNDKGLVAKERKICIVGNKNIKILEDNWIDFPEINMFMFPNLEYLGNGDYTIIYFKMSNSVETAYMRNFVRTVDYGDESEKDQIYIGENLKFIEYTNEDLESIKKGYNGHSHCLYFGGGIIDISPKNKYYRLENNVLYSKDLKKIYVVLPNHKNKVEFGQLDFDNDIEEILPFSFGYNYYGTNLNFKGKINKIDKYAFIGRQYFINFNEVELLSGELFFDTAYGLHVSVERALNVADNAYNLASDRLCTLEIKN